MLEVKSKLWLTPRGSVCLMIFTAPQLEIFTGTGAMKSFTSAVKEDDERLLRNVLPNASQVPAGKTPASVRSTAASPKRPVVSDRPAIGSLIVPVLTAPSANPAALRLMRLSSTPSSASSVGLAPQHGSVLAERQSEALSPCAAVSHLTRPSVGVPLPEKS